MNNVVKWWCIIDNFKIWWFNFFKQPHWTHHLMTANNIAVCGGFLSVYAKKVYRLYKFCYKVLHLLMKCYIILYTISKIACLIHHCRKILVLIDFLN